MLRLFVAILLTTFIATSSEARVCHSDGVTGRVVSPTAIIVEDLYCSFTIFKSHSSPGGLLYTAREFDRGLLIHVSLKKPEDMDAMQPGDLVKVKGRFTAESLNGRNRLTVTDAELIR
jgi:hypothetical protein